MKLALVLFLVLNCFQAFACQCPPLTKSEFNELLKEVDIAVVASAITNVHENDTLLYLLNERRKGSNIQMKVDSVLKGYVIKDQIIINQSGGSCTQVFEFDKKYLILGYEIKGFGVRELPDETSTDNSESTPAVQPPPPPPIGENDSLYYYDLDRSVFWNNLVTENSIISTDICNSFESGSTFYSMLIND